MLPRNHCSFERAGVGPWMQMTKDNLEIVEKSLAKMET
jgi:hypothetical protein